MRIVASPRAKDAMQAPKTLSPSTIPEQISGHDFVHPEDTPRATRKLLRSKVVARSEPARIAVGANGRRQEREGRVEATSAPDNIFTRVEPAVVRNLQQACSSTTS